MPVKVQPSQEHMINSKTHTFVYSLQFTFKENLEFFLKNFRPDFDANSEASRFFTLKLPICLENGELELIDLQTIPEDKLKEVLYLGDRLIIHEYSQDELKSLHIL